MDEDQAYESRREKLSKEEYEAHKAMLDMANGLERKALKQKLYLSLYGNTQPFMSWWKERQTNVKK